MKGDRKDFPNTLTIGKCVSYCAGRGYAYAGLQDGSECYCSNEKPRYTWFANDSDCDSICDGNQREICGGSLRLSIYIAKYTQGAKYIGCYKERSVEARLMYEEQRNFKNSLTPAICIGHCKGQGYAYAGTQYRFECFCSNTRPSFKSSADEKDCEMTCEGDTNQICGGGSRLSVYETSILQNNFVESNYLGCYADSGQMRSLNGKKINYPNRLTPELCVGFCYRYGYRFAGVQNGTQCICGDSLTGSQVQEYECSDNCPNNRFTCGGYRRSSIYSTQITDYSEDGKLLGCFTDNETLRLLSAISMKFTEKNTPKLCLNVCLQLGYKYSGVEYGNECYCGNRRPASDLEVGENHCAIPCPGDRRKNCGGGWRILVYSTSGTAYHRPPIIPVTTTTTTTTKKPIYIQQTQKPTLQQTSRPQQQTPRPQQQTPRPQQQTTKKPVNRPQSQPSQTHKTTTTVRTTTSSNTLMLSSPSININRPRPNRNCVESLTEVDRKKVCKGEMLFKEDFLSEISPEKWSHDVKMPWIPDYEFVVLQKKAQNAYVRQGKLHLRPTLQEDQLVRRGKLELPRCTGTPYTEECVRQAATFSILPPIESARISTKESLTFKYGIVQVRAKLPKGDWLIPEIWLEPKRKVYGPSYASGRIRIAMARGNRNLMADGSNIGNRILESGILMGVGEHIRGRTVLRDKIDGWSKHFHNYTLIWTPDDLKFLVDGEHEESVVTRGSSLSDLVEFDESTAITWRAGTKIAPFDQEFYLSLGISVGGMRDFPDECTSDGHKKPWRNMAVKAMLNFWQDRNYWLNTWTDDESLLQIEHVRIQAL